jgi:hypothetical protein
MTLTETVTPAAADAVQVCKQNWQSASASGNHGVLITPLAILFHNGELNLLWPGTNTVPTK